MSYYILISALCIFLAKRDGHNYKMFGKPRNNVHLLKWWHIDGAIIYVIGLGTAVYYDWQLAAFAGLFRLGMYDIVHNFFAGMPIAHIGTEAITDKITKVIFRNTIIKAAVCTVAIIILLWVKST